MSNDSRTLAKKLELWFATNQPRPSPPPPVQVDARLPDGELDASRVDKQVAQQLQGFRVFSGSGWEPICRDVSSLASRLSDPARQRLMESLKVISAPPPVDPQLLSKWLAAVGTLLPGAYSAAIMEFFQLAWMWEQVHQVAGIELEQLLVLLFKGLRAMGEGSRSAAMMHFLIQLGARWPGRLAYWLDHVAKGGSEVIQSLKRAEGFLSDCEEHAHASLLDFAAEYGWKMTSEDDAPVWQAIGRAGDSLLRRIKISESPVENIRLLGGVLGALHSSDAFESLAHRGAIGVVSELFGEKDAEVVDAALSLVPDAETALKVAWEVDLAVDILSLRGVLHEPIRTGRQIVELARFIAGGTPQPDLLRELFAGFRGSISEGAVASAVSFAQGLGDDIPKQSVELWLRIARLMGLATGGEELPPRLKTAVERVFGMIMRMESPAEAVELLEEAVSMSSVGPDDVYRGCAMLLRSVPDMEPTDLLRKALLLGRLAGSLSREDGIKFLSELPPRWLEILADEISGNLQKVVDSVCSIDEVAHRGRFLERILEPLVEQVTDREALFEEYLAAAISEYNKAGNLSALRNTELDLVQRFFHHEDRRRALDHAISELLRIPGLEGERADAIVGHVKRLCDVLSLQDVWQGRGDKELLAFLDDGLRSLVTAFMEVPEAVDVFDEEARERLISKLLPAASEAADESVATWQLRTGSIFFGRVVPLIVELLGSDAEMLRLILDKVSDFAVQSVAGVPAGPSFLPEVERHCEQFLVENLTLGLQARLAEQKPFALRLGEDWPAEIFDSWKGIRSKESRLLREASKVARSISSERRIQRRFLRQARKLMEGMTRAGLSITNPGIFAEEEGEVLLKDVLEVIPKSEDFTTVLLKLEKDSGAIGSSVVASASEKMGIGKGAPGENPARAWRKRVFSPLGNCVVSLLMVQEARSSEVDLITDDFLEVVEFLGIETGADNLLLALEHAIAVGDAGKPVLTVDHVRQNLEKQLFKPLWRRRAMSRLELLTAGRDPKETITDRLLDRLGEEETIAEQVVFLRRFGQLFLVLEEAILRLEEKKLDLHIHDALKDTWLFNPERRKAASGVDIARNAVGTASDVFRQIRRRRGEVTAAEAEEISHEMRQKYRDNAGVVAILLRWTIDPERQALLSVLEGKPVLLESVSRDSELAELMDSISNVTELTETVKKLATDPDRLKTRLREMYGGQTG